MLAVFVLGISFTLQGQNWDLINKNNVYNYSLTRGSTANADATIWTDSTGLEEGDSVFFLNRVMLEDPGGFYYFLNQSQFLQGKVRMKNPESWVFSGPETFEINPMAQENESWLFDTTNKISARVIQSTSGYTFGKADSIKTILLSNGDTLRLSKSFGILQFPLTGKMGYYYLAGIDNLQMGLTVPKINDFISFQVNDSFEFKKIHGFYTPANPHTAYTETWQYRFRITRIEQHLDTLLLWRNGIGFTGNKAGYLIHDSLVINLKESAYLNLFNNEMITNDLEFYTFNLLSYNPEHNVFQKDIQTTRLNYLSTDTFIHVVFGEQGYSKFIPKIGCIHKTTRIVGNDLSTHQYSEDMVACRKKDVSFGNFSPDSLFNHLIPPPTDLTRLIVFPNPATDIIRIQNLPEHASDITIWNQQGQCVYHQHIESTLYDINIAQLAPGMYFISTPGTLRPVKLIKTTR